MAPSQIRWKYAIGIPLIHLLACLAFVPWLFSWTGVACALFGLYVFGTLGINLCYHRLLTHRGLVAPKWLEHSLAILGVCNLQDTPACWIAMHRLHHQHSDEQPDPHSPMVSFFWGHCGWLMFKNREVLNLNYYQRFTRDILRDPFYMKLERSGNWLSVYLASVLCFLPDRTGDRLADWRIRAGRCAIWTKPRGVGCVCSHRSDVASDLER